MTDIEAVSVEVIYRCSFLPPQTCRIRSINNSIRGESFSLKAYSLAVYLYIADYICLVSTIREVDDLSIGFRFAAVSVIKFDPDIDRSINFHFISVFVNYAYIQNLCI